MDETNQGAPQGAQSDPRARAAQCAREVDAILARHGCRIIGHIDSVEVVGQGAQKVLVAASYVIVPVTEPKG